MSRLAKKPIILPEGVSVKEASGTLSFKGPKGEAALRILPLVTVSVIDGGIQVAPAGEARQSKANAGTMWSLAKNAAEGVASGFKKILEIEGVGYRATLEGNALLLALGYVQPVKFEIPKGISVVVEKNVITISGIDKHLVGQAAATIRQFKKPEPYKGKGIRYQGEVIKRKAGKKATSTAA